MLQHSTAVQPPSALQYGMFVKAAYDVYNANPANLNPSQDEYPFFPDGYNLLFNIQMNDFIGSYSTPKYYGFFAENESNPSDIIVAIRGTQTWEEWWDDFHWGLVPFPYNSNGGNVADGFITIYETITLNFPNATAASPSILLKDTAAHPELIKAGLNFTLTATGHSLGSALITLYAADITSRGNGTQPRVYTFASPRVGDKGFANMYNVNVATNYRIYNWPDIVPDFPKDPFDNYQHVKGGYEVDSLDYPLTVRISVECFHSLLTYLFLVGAPQSILNGCGY